MKMKQITDTLLMVRPVDYRMNEETAVNNYFQKEMDLHPDEITLQAQKEFDGFVDKLRKVGVQVLVMDDIKENKTPDSVFPNNWFSTHQNGSVVIYPIYAENRRRERREDVFIEFEKQGFKITGLVDYTSAEADHKFLEGTGSCILDRQNRKAYCALSPRTDEDLVLEFCEDFEYTPIIFTAYQNVKGERKPIYHTNVMMCVAENFAVIGLESIDNKQERKMVAESLKEDGKEIIALTEEQLHQFAGNMLQVRGAFDKKYLVMSEAAHKSLTDEQIKAIEKHCELLSSDLNTIETLGGGSARCMLAEVFLPKA